MSEQYTDLFKKVKEAGIVMSNVPKPTKEAFIQLSEEYFSDSYGQALKWCLDQAIEYQQMKETLFNGLHEKLDTIISNTQSQETKDKIPDENGMKTVRLLGGNKIKFKEVKKHE